LKSFEDTNVLPNINVPSPSKVPNIIIPDNDIIAFSNISPISIPDFGYNFDTQPNNNSIPINTILTSNIQPMAPMTQLVPTIIPFVHGHEQTISLSSSKSLLFRSSTTNISVKSTLKTQVTTKPSMSKTDDARPKKSISSSKQKILPSIKAVIYPNPKNIDIKQEHHHEKDNETSSATTTSTEETVKQKTMMRTACDSCTRLKKRCVRKEGTECCQRCVKHDRICNFSMQLKRGRSPKAKEDPSAEEIKKKIKTELLNQTKS